MPQLLIPVHRDDLCRVDHPDGQVPSPLHGIGAAADGLGHGERIDADPEQVPAG